MSVGDTELDANSASVSILGPDQDFSVIESTELQKYLDMITVEQGTGGSAITGMDVTETEEPIVDPDA